MTDRAEIVAKLIGKLEEFVDVEPGSIATDKPLLAQAGIDSLDLIEIGMAVEEEFGLAELGADDWPWAAWTVDKIADAVIAQISKEAART